MGDILGSIFGSFGDVAQYLNGLTQLWTWLGSLLQGLWKFLQSLWQFLVKRIIGGILAALRAMQTWLEHHLQPMVDYLQQLVKTLRRYWNTYVQPMLIWMERVRKYIHLLALLHIHVAQQLDNYLAKLQAKILQGFYTVTAAINTLTNILLALQDPTYLIKHPVLLISIRRQIPALIHAITGRPPGYWFPSPRGAKGGVWAAPSIPFNFADPTQNPPTSSYLGNDGLPADLAPYVNCYEYMETSVDAVQPIDYFDDSLYPTNLCPYDDPAKCLLWSWGYPPGG